MSLKKRLLNTLISRDVRALAERMEFGTGESGYDPWGFHLDEAMLGLSLSKWLYERYFKVQCSGIENVPASGRCLIVANHSGQVFPIDAMMTSTAVALREQHPRAVRAMVERFFPTTPYLGDFVFRMGMTLGDPVNCSRLLQHEEAIIVFPEGERGFIKNPDQKYQLQRMGNGFIRMAVENDTPIIPVGIVGCEELTLNFGREETLARKFGLPALPLSPPLALPTRIYLNFGEPLRYPKADYSNSEYDDMVLNVRERLEQLIAKGLSERTAIYHSPLSAE